MTPPPEKKTSPTVHVAHLADDEDVAASFAVLSASFGHDAPFVDAYYPLHDTAAGRAQGAARLAAWRLASAAKSAFLKAVLVPGGGGADGNDGGGGEGERREKIVGFAIWTLMREPPSPDLRDAEPHPEAVWPDPSDREFVRRLWREYVVPRSRAVEAAGGKGVYGE